MEINAIADMFNRVINQHDPERRKMDMLQRIKRVLIKAGTKGRVRIAADAGVCPATLDRIIKGSSPRWSTIQKVEKVTKQA